MELQERTRVGRDSLTRRTVELPEDRPAQLELPQKHPTVRFHRHRLRAASIYGAIAAGDSESSLKLKLEAGQPRYWWMDSLPFQSARHRIRCWRYDFQRGR